MNTRHYPSQIIRQPSQWIRQPPQLIQISSLDDENEENMDENRKEN